VAAVFSLGRLACLVALWFLEVHASFAERTATLGSRATILLKIVWDDLKRLFENLSRQA